MTLEDALQIHSGNPKSDFKYKSLMTELYTYYKKNARYPEKGSELHKKIQYSRLKGSQWLYPNQIYILSLLNRIEDFIKTNQRFPSIYGTEDEKLIIHGLSFAFHKMNERTQVFLEVMNKIIKLQEKYGYDGSILEKECICFLEKRNYSVLREIKFRNLKNKTYLRFDLAVCPKQLYFQKPSFLSVEEVIKNKILLIETDGIQHFKSVDFSGKKSHEETQSLFEDLRKKDLIKNEFCERNNIPLLRIKYSQLSKIEKVLEDFLNTPMRYLNIHSLLEDYYGEQNNENNNMEL